VNIENNLTKEELVRCIDYILWNVGIYPQSISGGDTSICYEKRDDYRNGWNDGVMSVTKQFDKLIDKDEQAKLLQAAIEWENEEDE